MNQEKIGRFIAESRKKKNMTQEELAEKLNINSRSISRWENGKNMPDVSLYKPLCDELDITINELLSGKKIEDESYQEKFEENIINVIIEDKKRIKGKILKISVLILIILFIGLWSVSLYNTRELDVEYTPNMMTCHFEDDTLIYEEFVSVYNTNYIEKIVGDNKYLIFHSTVPQRNKKHSEWEIKENFSNYVGNSNTIYSSGIKLEQVIDEYENVFVYYTDKPLKKVSKSSNEDFKNILEESYFMCSYK